MPQKAGDTRHLPSSAPYPHAGSQHEAPVLVAFLLLLAGEWLGWQRHLPINGAKTSIVILLTLGYSILLWFIYRRGMPGRALAYCCVALFIASMSIFLVS